MRLEASPDVRVTVRPFRSYRQLAQAPEQGWWVALRGPLKWLGVMACFVALTTSGRLTLDHLLLVPLSWSFVPLYQCAWLLLVMRLFRVSLPRSAAVDLYYRGHLPWLLVLLLFAGICVLAPDVWAGFRMLLASRILFVLLLVAQGWCCWLSYALFRAGLDLPRKAAIGATALFYAGVWGTILTYFALAGQLAPILGLIE